MKFTVHNPTTRSQHAEAREDRSDNRSGVPTIGDVIAARMGRRDMLKGVLGFTAISATVGPMALAARGARAQGSAGSFAFEEITAKVTEGHEVAPGYDADILLRWGDPLFPDSPPFDPMNQSAAAQARQFGYNNDFVGFVPHPDAPEDADRGVLVVNHEYTNEELMFPGLGRQDEDAVGFAGMTKDLIDVEMAAHGGTVVEIARSPDGKWSAVIDSPLNRRITAKTPIAISGPAAGHDKLKTSDDPTGREVLGTINNCAGGITPWNTWLMAEENFNGYFWSADDQSQGEGLEDDPAKVAFERYGIPGRWYAWGQHYDRFDVAKEPNEPNRFGWMVEVDPANPNAAPVKRTALGRFKHEGAHSVLNPDGRVVVFMGDDQRFDYVYRFVSDAAWDPSSPDRDILDKGTLSVARFEANGTVHWMPLTFGTGPLTPENDFADQGDVMVQTRRAADFLEATPMDRPEDVEPNPERGTVYVMLTNNTRRKPGEENAANPRPENVFGHIIEITAPDMDFAADTMTWEILVKCGDPKIAEVGATFSTATTEDGWFGMPDNCAVDPDGRLWISTDGNSGVDTGRSDGLWSLETEGDMRATSKHFFRCPAGAELCGPYFTPDGETLFLAIQHPGDGGEDWPEFGRVSTFDDPSTRWPDFQPGMPPRPAVMTVTKRDGGRIA
ncbi:PhoX family protein [Jannaschia donghaensis]|uniref:Putative phosphatase n=1 Tax=Jannaschia donghaensis TaxID=420998 RepID=A0A0M6YND4_9RHOB|nr:PhoX family phosphatase [Jannaschia donghaensis]CTQ50526.1 putative phosphatase [Jannaschia donghaensis]